MFSEELNNISWDETTARIAAMTDNDRRALKTDMDTMLMNIESNDEYFLPYYFPINMKYFNGYKEKK